MKQESFNEYVEAFKALPLQKKKNMVEDEIKKTLAFIMKANEDMGLKDEIIFNKEILDLKSDNISDEDFVEAMFVYIHVIEESLGKYFNSVEKFIYKEDL